MPTPVDKEGGGVPKRYNGWELAEQADGPLVEYADYAALLSRCELLEAALLDLAKFAASEIGLSLEDCVSGPIGKARALTAQRG